LAALAVTELGSGIRKLAVPATNCAVESASVPPTVMATGLGELSVITVDPFAPSKFSNNLVCEQSGISFYLDVACVTWRRRLYPMQGTQARQSQTDSGMAVMSH